MVARTQAALVRAACGRRWGRAQSASKSPSSGGDAGGARPAPLLDSRPVDLQRLADAIAPVTVLERGARAADVRELAYDARAVTPGALFFCVPGARVDGHG